MQSVVSQAGHKWSIVTLEVPASTLHYSAWKRHRQHLFNQCRITPFATLWRCMKEYSLFVYSILSGSTHQNDNIIISGRPFKYWWVCMKRFLIVKFYLNLYLIWIFFLSFFCSKFFIFRDVETVKREVRFNLRAKEDYFTNIFTFIHYRKEPVIRLWPNTRSPPTL